LANPQEVHYDVWQWEDPDGWIDVLDTNDTLDFSNAFSTARLCQHLRSILNNATYRDYLISYYYVEGGACLSVIGTLDTRLLYGMNTQAPDWWSLEEGLSPLQRRLEQIKIFSEVVSQHLRKRGPRKVMELETRVHGFCARCGLPDDRHVSHEVPGFDPKKLVFHNPNEARPYMEAFKRHYGGALKKLRDSDLLMMPLPPNLRNLRLVLLEIQGRIENPVIPASAVDRMLAGGLLDE
jgi:hypothetical protein